MILISSAAATLSGAAETEAKLKAMGIVLPMTSAPVEIAAIVQVAP